jgi:hypothetical protein
MIEREDWLQDSLGEIVYNVFNKRALRNYNNHQQEKWENFHFATRLKLEGADFF